MAVLLSFPNVKQCMLVDRLTSGKNNQHQQEKFIPSLVRSLSTIFILFKKQWHWEKFHRNFSHTPKSRKPKSLSIERRILWWAVISYPISLECCYSNRRHLYQWTVYNAPFSPCEMKRKSEIKKETNVCLSSWKSRLHVIRFDASAGQQIHWDAWPFLLLF